jgi:hypothetical protein
MMTGAAIGFLLGMVVGMLLVSWLVKLMTVNIVRAFFTKRQQPELADSLIAELEGKTFFELEITDTKWTRAN